MTLKSMLELVTEYSGFSHHCLHNVGSAISFFNEIVSDTNSKVLLDVDYDPDGILSGVQVFETLRDLGVSNVEVHIPESKRHGVDDVTLFKLNDKFTHLIIVDSSTNSMETLKRISDKGVKVLIIDHHEPEYLFEDYPENVIIVNNKFNQQDYLVRELSAGFLTYLVTTDVRLSYNLERSKSHFVYGYTTLISDSCELSTDYIKPIILDISKYSNHVPRQMRLFMGDFDELNRSFISYRFANKINSVCRSNRPDLLRSLFFELDSLLSDDVLKLVSDIQDVYDQISVKVSKFSEHLYNFTEDIGSFVFVDISRAVAKTTLPTEYLINATGQFANAISKNFNKPCICVMPVDKITYKCSGRDCTGSIDLANMGNRFNLGGGGHKGAYGFEMSRYDLEDLKILLGTVELTTAHDVAIDCDSLSYIEFKHLIHQVSMYNEVAGNKLPLLNLRRTLNSSFLCKDIGRLRLFCMRDVELKDFNQRVNMGDEVEFTPVYARKPYCIIK